MSMDSYISPGEEQRMPPITPLDSRMIVGGGSSNSPTIETEGTGGGHSKSKSMMMSHTGLPKLQSLKKF